MSLRVWLPLNGDLKNNGLSDYSLSMFRGTETYNNDGKIGKCFYSNGRNTIKILNIIPDFYNYSAYSLCAWFYIETNNTSHSGSAIMSSGNWNQQVLNLALSDWSSDHYTKLRISGVNWNNTYNYNFNKNTWYHVVVSSDGKKTYAYVNGSLIGNTVTGFLPTSIEGNDICIGGATYYSGMQFFGKINDVRIYDHALSAKEVKEISKGLVCHYKLNDNYFNTVYDCSGYNHHGTRMTNTISCSTDTARNSLSTNFNGTDDGILIENLDLSPIINNSATYSFWIKPNGENGARSVYFGMYSGTSWSIEKTTGNVLRSYWAGSPDESCSGASITDGVWQHICIVKDGVNSIKVYINGVLKWTSTATHSNKTFSTTCRIGRDTRSGDGTPYKGLMSDFRIYATALSADDIMQLYKAPISIANNGTLFTQGEFVEL